MAGEYSDATIYVVFSLCYALAAISTGLRLYVRRFMIRRPLQLDDYLIIASFSAFTASIVLSLFAVSNNLLHLEEATFGQLRQDMQILFVLAILYLLDLWVVKFSILAFYTYIFLRPSTKVLIRLTAIYLVLSLGCCYIAELLFCRPISSFWNPLRAQTDCHDANGIAIIHCVMAVTSDILIMVIPLGTLAQLRINLKKKLSLGILFAAGSFAVIASILRAAMSIRDLHYPMTISRVLLWGTVEQTVATIVANAPGLRVLIFPGQDFVSRSGSGPRSTSGYTRERSVHDELEMTNRAGPMTVVSSSSSKKEDKAGIRKSGLMVMGTVEMNIETDETGKGVDEDSSSCESTKWRA